MGKGGVERCFPRRHDSNYQLAKELITNAFVQPSLHAELSEVRSRARQADRVARAGRT